MKDIEWGDGYIKVASPGKPKKITGTHLPEVLGLHPWSTEFEAWCRCTRTYEKPFEGNKFTNAGQIIEPKVFDFLRKSMGLGDRLRTPTDLYGEDYFKKTWGDFFRNIPIFGGSWDALILSENKKDVEYVVEVKTVLTDGRSGDLEDRWKDGNAPHYQALQAALYAYLLNVDKVLMVAVTMEDSRGDYEHPEQVIPSFANENVYIDEFSVSERYPNFDLMVEKAKAWWNDHVVTGVSPAFDEKRDADILKVLRTNTVAPETDIADLITEAEALRQELDAVSASVADKEKRLKTVTEQIKAHAVQQFRDGDKKVSLTGKVYDWVVTRTETATIDKDALKADGVLEKYTVKKPGFTLKPTLIKS